jgi:hypothetical protein
MYSITIEQKYQKLENILKKKIEILNHFKEIEDIENTHVIPFTGGLDDNNTKHVIFYFNKDL